jgi:phospholipid transport system substrate-binding protein
MPSLRLPLPPPTIRRWLGVLLALGGSALALPAAAAGTAGPAATPQALCDALIAAMKAGVSRSFAQRVDSLGPEIRQDLDLGLMTRIVVGPPWRQLSPADRQGLVDAFSNYSIATYASRFQSYSGERFEVDPIPVLRPNGDAIVHTKLFTGGADFVQLDYLLRKSGGSWRIIDVFLSGTISELAARRSEYSATLRLGGAPALAALLRQKAVELGK